MTARLTVAKGWKFIRQDGTHFMLWQHETYRVFTDPWKGYTGSVLDVIQDETTVAVRLSVPGGYLVVNPEELEETT